MRISLALFGLAATSFCWAGSPLPDTLITVYTTQAYPVARQELADRLYHLDAVDNLEEQFGKLLNSSYQVAEQQVGQLLQSKQGKLFQEQLQQAYVGVVEGWKSGVMKVPAVVFESSTGRFKPAVVYGETDVAKAIQQFQAYRSRY